MFRKRIKSFQIIETPYLLKAQKIYDPDLAVRFAGGSQEAADTAFELFSEKFSEYADAVKAAQDAKNLEALIAATHKLHGALCYIGAPRLKEITGEIERALRTLKDITKIDRHYQQF